MKRKKAGDVDDDVGGKNSEDSRSGGVPPQPGPSTSGGAGAAAATAPVTDFIDEKELMRSLHYGVMLTADDVTEQIKERGEIKFEPDVLSKVTTLLYDTVVGDWTTDLLAFSSHANRVFVNTDDVSLLMRRNPSLARIVREKSGVTLDTSPSLKPVKKKSSGKSKKEAASVVNANKKDEANTSLLGFGVGHPMAASTPFRRQTSIRPDSGLSNLDDVREVPTPISTADVEEIRLEDDRLSRDSFDIDPVIVNRNILDVPTTSKTHKLESIQEKKEEDDDDIASLDSFDEPLVFAPRSFSSTPSPATTAISSNRSTVFPKSQITVAANSSKKVEYDSFDEDYGIPETPPPLMARNILTSSTAPAPVLVMNVERVEKSESPDLFGQNTIAPPPSKVARMDEAMLDDSFEDSLNFLDVPVSKITPPLVATNNRNEQVQMANTSIHQIYSNVSRINKTPKSSRPKPAAIAQEKKDWTSPPVQSKRIAEKIPTPVKASSSSGWSNDFAAFSFESDSVVEIPPPSRPSPLQQGRGGKIQTKPSARGRGTPVYKPQTNSRKNSPVNSTPKSAIVKKSPLVSPSSAKIADMLDSCHDDDDDDFNDL